MTDNRTWWPEGYGDDPAFQVRRIIYGTVTGGDYARGSSVLTLPKTAVRFPTLIAGAADAVSRAILHVRVKNHYTRREAILSPTGVVERYINWNEGDIEVTWGWPVSIEHTWTDVALVRSAFGRPSTVNDGQTVMSGHRDAFYQKTSTGEINYDEDGNPILALPPVFTDTGLPSGRWYHYGLFFKVSEVDWIQGMLDSCLLPRDFHHDQHLWDNVPPYYRWTDENSMVGNGYLQQFLSVFGFELDTCREFVESWQHVYDVDWSPIRLLRKLGPNFGYDYEQGIGDIRYRSLFSEIGHLYDIRGTQTCLEEVVRKMSKFECDVTSGANLLLLPDDSDFATGAGNWGVVLDSTDAPGSGYLGHTKVTIAPDSGRPPPVGIGRRVLTLWTAASDATADIGIACGDSYVSVDPVTGAPYAGSGVWKEVTPVNGGVPVERGMSYGFSVWLQSQLLPTAVQLSLLWFDATGTFISASSGVLTSLAAASTWEEFSIGTVQVPPANAVYVTPYILFDTRSTNGSFVVTSPVLNLAGAMVYATETIGESVGPPPDRYLTISDPGEPLGGALTFKGTLSGASTALPTGAALNDAYVVVSPVPTATPQFLGVTPPRNAANNDAIYWNGTVWVNAGPLPDTWKPFLLGSPTPGGT